MSFLDYVYPRKRFFSTGDGAKRSYNPYYIGTIEPSDISFDGAYYRVSSDDPIITSVFPKVSRVIYAPPATIVFWGDGTKTVVKCAEDSEYSPYHGFCAAVAKKVFGTNSAVRRAAGLPKEKKEQEEPIITKQEEPVAAPEKETGAPFDEPMDGTAWWMKPSTYGWGTTTGS